MRSGGMTWHMASVRQSRHIPVQSILTVSFVLVPVPALEQQQRRANERVTPWVFKRVALTHKTRTCRHKVVKEKNGVC